MSTGGGLLALDISPKRTGYAFALDERAPAPRASSWTGGDHGDIPRSCAEIAQSVAQLCGLIKPAVCVIEAPLQIAHGGFSSGHIVLLLTSMFGAAAGSAHAAGCRVYPANVQTWRKHFVGAARPQNPKRVTIDRCKLIGWEPKNDDEADAMGLWHYGMSVYFKHWRQVGTPMFARGAAA